MATFLLNCMLQRADLAWSIDCPPPSPHLLKFVAVYACVKRCLDACLSYNNFPWKVCENVADGTKIVTRFPYPTTSSYIIKSSAVTTAAAFHCSLTFTRQGYSKFFKKYWVRCFPQFISAADSNLDFLLVGNFELWSRITCFLGIRRALNTFSEELIPWILATSQGRFHNERRFSFPFVLHSIQDLKLGVCYKREK